MRDKVEIIQKKKRGETSRDKEKKSRRRKRIDCITSSGEKKERDLPVEYCITFYRSFVR